MFTVTIEMVGGTYHKFIDQKWSKVMSLIKSASQFGDILCVSIVNPTPILPEVKK